LFVGHEADTPVRRDTLLIYRFMDGLKNGGEVLVITGKFVVDAPDLRMTVGII
jgi:hypothetical protein